jgi:hypothetical protein
MSKNFALFPTLSEILKGKIRFQEQPYHFFYTTEENEKELPLKCEDSTDPKVFSLYEENGPWNVDEYNFGFSRTYTIRSHQFLFGNKGIVCKNAGLGIAVVWTSSDSKQRGVIPAQGEIRFTDESVELSVKHQFDKAQLRGSVGLRTVLYIKATGSPNKDEKHLANTSGFILGELDNELLLLDGNGSSFPVITTQAPGQPLWWVKCDWEDPTEDAFSESVAIYLNEKHKNYAYIDRKSGTYNPQLVVEIFSQALLVIIMKLKQNEIYWHATFTDDNLATGSVSEAVAYFANSLDWDLQSIENMSLSIRKFFEEKFL